MDFGYRHFCRVLIILVFSLRTICKSEQCFCLKKQLEGIDSPVFFEEDPKNGKFYVAQQSGVIHVYSADWKRELKPLVNLSHDVYIGSSPWDERGLLSIALHPSFSTNNLIFIYSTRLFNKKEYSVISKVEIRPELLKEVILLAIEQHSEKRNGGQVLFGKDGHLYISVGDGGTLDDRNISFAQNSKSLLGKILRVDVNKEEIVDDHLQFYAVPDENPFVSNSSYRPEIYALGARNMWRCSIDRGSVMGDLYCGDAGDKDREEINLIQAGKNYGWNFYEGSVRENSKEKIKNENPLYEYPHGDMGQAVVGGYVYRGKSFPNLQSNYVFGDYVSGKLFILNNTVIAKNVTEFKICEKNRCPCDSRDKAGQYLQSFSTDNTGELYLLTKQNGEILKLIPPLSSVTTCGSIQLSTNTIVTVIIAFVNIVLYCGF